jgi:pimeloyl-ACP methyl ester carboxylesterase
VTQRCWFVPGLAVRGSLYRPGLPTGWEALDPLEPGVTRGRFQAYRDRLVQQLVEEGRPVTLGGHSMGAALAICAAAERPELVERLLLFSPAGLPLSKPMRESFRVLVRQAFKGLYPPGEMAAVVRAAARHPWATYQLARETHDLDLTDEMRRVALARVPALVVGCSSDTLTTPAVCRSIADGLGGDYREIDGRGHVWMLNDWPTFRAILAAG